MLNGLGIDFQQRKRGHKHSGNNDEKQKKGQPRATISIAVESEDFVRRTQQRNGIKVKRRKIVEKDGAFTLREPMSDYGLYSGPENNPIVPENSYLWDVL
ncbi:MAG: hypothetical protein ACQ9MH_27220 [Nitrospinales bacterium]